jgi:hypothetical protein
MIELVSGMPARYGDDIYVSARIRAGSRFKRFLCFVFIDAKGFTILLVVRVTQVENH